ncbi:MAG: hypothetical protein K9J27_01505 [Bacteroidales bacterium]|nr:hypothetical protein [Bacteroidales bacterium]MCF8332650.1 hypothetical protein [Bacteroidales bacterium]
MKNIFTVILSLTLLTAAAQDEYETIVKTKSEALGQEIKITFLEGEAHNHPLMAFWIEDTAGNYLETLYVAESIATSVFEHGKAGSNGWEPGIQRRPAALPYWGHQRGIEAKDGLFIPHPDNPMPDAVTGPTPQSNFTLKTKADTSIQPPFRILMEINQPWDWNDYWTNSKFPGNKEYITSSQPALVYAVTIKSLKKGKTYEMNPVGRSHHSGENGKLYGDLETLTTAKKIVKSVKVKFIGNE